MYKFYKVFSSGHEKYCETFNSTLDANYHSYINWCEENGMSWKLVRVFDNKIMYQG